MSETKKIGGKLVIATHNAGKLREMRDLLAPFGVEAISAGELGLSEPEETASDFVGNALIKARAAAKTANLPAFADDSGLCVEALKGAPGIYSARWAGPDKDFGAAMAQIAAEVAASGSSSKRAHFVSALALCWPDGAEQTFVGEVFGELTFPPRGDKGFGYDPCFTPDGHDRTFGEMSRDEKHGVPADGSEALSHRARAFQALTRSGVF